jgi:hypothetical protein
MANGAYIRTEEHKQKMSKALIGKNKGKKRTEEQNKRNSEAQKIAQNKLEVKQKISEANKGKKRTKEQRKNISDSLIGRKLSKECCEKLSKAHQGKKLSIEHRKNMSKASKGKPKSDKHKQNMRIKAAERVEKFGTGPNFTPEAVVYFRQFDLLNNTNGIYKDPETNQREFLIKSIGRFPDYINFELKLIIEIDDSGHFDIYGNQKIKHILRQDEIQELYPDFKFLRFKKEEMHKLLEYCNNKST